MHKRVLIVAGSDPSGGAGIQADIKTVTAMGGYAAAAITALTAQNTTGVYGVHEVPPEFIARQIELVLADIGADALKTGMLHSAEVIGTVAGALEDAAADVPLVADPVMVAKSGDALLRPDAVTALRNHILPLAAVLTPNLREAEALLGHTVESLDGMKEAARDLLDMGPRAVLLKGGHAGGPTVFDVLAEPGDVTVFEHARLDTTSTHGTGCTLASAVAAGLASGLPLRGAVEQALDYVHEAMLRAPGLGRGRGPLGHARTQV